MSVQEMFQLNEKTGMRVFDKELKNLVKERRFLNDEVKSLVINEFTRHSSTNLTDSVGTTLLHLAAQYNNVEMIEFLLELGCTVNVKNSFGQTPLLAAFLSKHWKSVEILLHATDICTNDDAERLLQLLVIQKDQLPATIPIIFMQKLKKFCGDDYQTIADILFKVNNNFPLNFIVYVGDARLTQMMLETPNYTFDLSESTKALRYATEVVDLENLRVLYQFNHITRYTLLLEIDRWLKKSHVNWKLKPLLENLTVWISFDGHLEPFLFDIFSSASKRNIEMLLQQCNVDVQIRQKYNFDVLPILFGNCHFDSKSLIELISKRQFNVNSRSFGGQSALHYSAMINSSKNIRFLLKLGADCNVKCDHGSTPLRHASDSECVELLLKNGANLKADDVDNLTVLEQMFLRSDTPWNNDAIKVMLTQLAVDYHRGVQIKQSILDGINEKEMFKDHFEDCLKQVKELTNYEILTKLTLYDIITMNVENLANHVKSREIINMIMIQRPLRSLRLYYFSLLELHLEKAYNVYLAKCRFAKIVSENVSNTISFDHLVVDKLCEFSTYADILALVSM